jgi:hypothetical protein
LILSLDYYLKIVLNAIFIKNPLPSDNPERCENRSGVEPEIPRVTPPQWDRWGASPALEMLPGEKIRPLVLRETGVRPIFFSSLLENYSKIVTIIIYILFDSHIS